jgi:hypothetical protein
MKKIAVLLAISCMGYAQAQTDSAEIYQVYADFESTVKNNESQQLIQLFATPQAPVYIVKKNPTGPTIWGLWGAQQFANSQSGTNNQELQISDIKLHADDNFAITDAHFDEILGTNPSAYGRDLFGYIRTLDGWKLLFLHNTVVLVNDNTDYSTAFDLPSTTDELMTEFTTRFNQQSASFGDLFLRMDNQVLVFNDTLPASYHYSENELRDFLLDMLDNPKPRTIAFENLETYVVDDYLATVFADYSIEENGVEVERGRSYITMLGTINEGWQVSSWVRDLDPIPNTPTGLLQPRQITPSILPNPVDDYVRVDWGQAKDVEWYLIQVGSGKTVLNGISSAQIDVIDTSSLAKGTYLLSAKSSNGERFGHTRLVKTAD